MTLAEAFKQVAIEYRTAQSKQFAGHELAKFIRRDIPERLGNLIGKTSGSYLIKGSAGQSQWVASPWAAILDPVVTRSPEMGYYPVFLFGPEFNNFSLVLGQGTYSVRKEFGKKTPEVLKARSEILRLRVPEYVKFFHQGPFHVMSSDVARGDWTPATVWGKTYELSSLPSDVELGADIANMLQLYHLATSRGGYDIESGNEDSVSQELEKEGDTSASQLDGTRRLRFHQKVERQRNTKLVRDVKKLHGYVCQGCGFDFSKVYGEKGQDCIDAHHLVPLSSLALDGPVLLDPKTDFAVLCANCHRMIHRMGCPSLPVFKDSVCKGYTDLLSSYSVIAKG